MSEEILAISHISKKFGDNTILDDISFSVKKGAVEVILGPSGSGKSTLLRCINALEQTDDGSIELNGKRIQYGNKNLPELRRRVGMVFQSYDLFPHLNVIDNIMLAPRKVAGRPSAEVKDEALKLLARVGLLDKQKSYPRQLSGGQKQRVAIVRALIMHPEIILFDEVTAALDPEMVREVLDVMIGLAKEGATMVIVTHEMAFARAIADEIIFLDRGKIVEKASPDKFFENPSTERARQFLDTFRFEKREAV